MLVVGEPPQEPVEAAFAAVGIVAEVIRPRLGERGMQLGARFGGAGTERRFLGRRDFEQIRGQRQHPAGERDVRAHHSVPGAAAFESERVSYDAAGAPVVSVDIPSGVDASTGEISGAAVTADLTVTFHASKIGLVVGPGRFRAGRVVVADIGLEGGSTATRRATPALLGRIPRRSPGDTKYSAGSVLVVGGQPGMTSAAGLTALAAFRADAGYVALAVPEESLRAAEVLALEPVKVPWRDDDAVETLVAAAEQDRLYAMWYLFATTGMRRSEMAALLWRNIDLEERLLSVTRAAVEVKGRVYERELTKSSSSRRAIELDDVDVKVLREHRRQVRHRCQHDLGLLGRVEMRVVSPFDAVGDERVTEVVLDCGIRMDRAERFDALGIVPALLDHHATRRHERRRVGGNHHATGNLERDVTNAVTELTDQNDFARRSDRDDVHPISRFEHVKIMLGGVAREP